MSTNDAIDTVFFDFDGTLVFLDPDSSDVISAFCAEIEQPLSPEAERHGRRIRHQYFIDPTIREQIAGLSNEEFWHHFNRHLLGELCIKGDLDRLAAELTGRFQDLEPHYICPEPGYKTLTELGARGCRLGLITNRNSVEGFNILLDRLSLRPYFELVLASGEVGVQKPDPGIFVAALEKIGASGGSSIYIGDNYWADVIGARRAGLTPVLLDPHHLFPEADCPILERIDEILDLLP